MELRRRIYGFFDETLIFDAKLFGSTLDAVSGLNGAINGAGNYAIGRKGLANTCYQFIGSGNNIGWGNLITLATDKISYSLWFKCTSSSQMMIFNQNYITGNLGGAQINGGKVWANDYTTVYNFRRTPLTYNNNAWHHLVITIDRALSGVLQSKIYIDSVLIATESAGYDNDLNGNFGGKANFSFFGAGGGAAGWYTGFLSEMKCWSRIITQSEVTSLYNE